MTKRKVAVVIPCFNHGEYLAEAVGSVGKATPAGVEVVIVDDGSTNVRTHSEVEKLAGQGFAVIRQKNMGLAAARNAGVHAATAGYILPLDADDRLRGGWLDKGMSVLDARPEVGVVYGDAQCFGTRTGRWSTGPFDLDKLLRGNFIHASALYRREVWEKNGGYDGTMPVQGYEDWDFWLGTAENGWKFEYLPEIFFDYRQLQQSMIKRTRPSYEAVREFVGRKHAGLYWEAWMRMDAERQSVKATARILRELLKTRALRRFGESSDGSGNQQ